MPEPSSLVLLGTGLMGVAGYTRRKIRSVIQTKAVRSTSPEVKEANPAVRAAQLPNDAYREEKASRVGQQ